jgi:hypothetical protein
MEELAYGPSGGWKNNIKMNIKDMCLDAECVHLARNKLQWVL